MTGSAASPEDASHRWANHKATDGPASFETRALRAPQDEELEPEHAPQREATFSFLRRWRRGRYRQDARNQPRTLRFDQHLIHQEARLLSGLSSRADREIDRNIDLRDAVCQHRDFHIRQFGIKAPRTLVQGPEALHGGVES